MVLVPTKLLESTVHILEVQRLSRGERMGQVTLTPVLHEHTIPISLWHNKIVLQFYDVAYIHVFPNSM